MAFQVLLNLTVAVIWVMLHNNWSVVSFFTGYVIGFAILFLLRRFLTNQFYGHRLVAALMLLFIFMRELILSNIAVLKQVVRPRMAIEPGIVALPIQLEKGWQITMLANLISLTPGTLTVDISSDDTTLFIHCMDIPDADKVISDIKNTFERRIREVGK